ncbi:phage minor capsid protein [Leifsonia sp. TF02-11]|uniref:phage minor capsid protein n=1 Tax=Leifsonia sp. TF02-11 TaxID=2815212 RepID=UPI001AA14FD8|nr:phage minor capsid protein [Leifsonia sp. TF02-11]MBO1739675.1 hypothetical protein [Leifsonia sp. TF02-11]
MSDPQPQQPPTGRQAEAALIALYLWAESALLGGMASLARGFLTGALSADTVRARIHRMALEVVNRLSRETPALTGAMVRGSAIEAVGPPRRGAGGSGGRGGSGGSHGGFLPPDFNPGFDPYQLHGIRAAIAIRDDIDSELADVRYRLTRLDDDLYKVIAPAGAAGQVLPIGHTSEQTQAKAWREFMRRGITGFTDKSGRDWALSSYVEMAVRTASQRAYNASRLQVVQSLGGNLVFVDDDGHPCPLCLPWQHVVLCIVPDGIHPSIADATAAGLFHPNCRHHMAQYFEGRTQLPAPREWTDELQAAYNATQRQRTLEREIRLAKRELEYARTPEARQAARRDVRDAQAKIRQFLAQHPELGLLRQSRREQLDLANDHLNVLQYDRAMR